MSKKAVFWGAVFTTVLRLTVGKQSMITRKRHLVAAAVPTVVICCLNVFSGLSINGYYWNFVHHITRVSLVE